MITPQELKLLLYEFTGEQLREILDERRRKVLTLRMAGFSFANISKTFGISGTRTLAIYKTAVWRLERYKGRADDALYGLSNRAANCLMHVGIKDKAQAAAAIRSKELSPNNPRCRSYGWKSHREVCVWAGVPYVEKFKQCPHCLKNIHAPSAYYENLKP